MSNPNNRRIQRLLDSLERRVHHNAGFYITAHSSGKAPRSLQVFFTEGASEQPPDVPASWYGYPVTVHATTQSRNEAVSPTEQLPDLHAIEQEVLNGFSLWTDARTVEEDLHVVRTPFRDLMGDPIEVGVTLQEDDSCRVTDGGTIAGFLFSSDNHEAGSPGLDLLLSLQSNLGFTVDFDLAEVYIDCQRDQLYQTVALFIQLISTIVFATPNLPEVNSSISQNG